MKPESTLIPAGFYCSSVSLLASLRRNMNDKYRCYVGLTNATTLGFGDGDLPCAEIMPS